ncbi:ATP phosphoribosyltransferase regulatory subunit [Fictibacillus iocasae]|uniref:ATP phosphoribosyltransferase regulatory subunit n=1 Tax=Fictibacillus iocasae TaxID=2715437 RepID=A0ABW2NKN4_9BACL
MPRPFVFEKPAGMRDKLPLFFQASEQIKQQLLKKINEWGYQMVQTPTLEYFDTVGEASAISDQQLFKLLDMEGSTLVLRPDMTAPIARVVSSSMKQVAYPLRLSYSAPVFRAQQREGGRPAEFEQVGVELIGDGTMSAEAEVLALMNDVLRETGIRTFTITIGHIGFVQELFIEILGNEERAEELRRFLFEKNYVGYANFVKNLPLSSIDSARLLKLLECRGGDRALDMAMDLAGTEKGKKAVQDLKELKEILSTYGAAEAINFDFTLLSHMSYYTGIVFEGYAAGIGSPIAGGGRYDDLLSRFDRSAPAIGFAVRLDYVMEAIGQHEGVTNRTCILYSGERRKEALLAAAEKRSKGIPAVAQDVAGVEDIDAFTKRFTDVVYLIGKTQGEETT